MITALSSKDVAFVPPLVTGIVVPAHAPADIVPAFVIPASNVIAFVIFPPVIVKSLATVKFPSSCTLNASVAVSPLNIV